MIELELVSTSERSSAVADLVSQDSSEGVSSDVPSLRDDKPDWSLHLQRVTGDEWTKTTPIRGSKKALIDIPIYLE